jgi:hypothetical protein
MNVNDAFGRLRRANPVVGDVGAPPIEHVLKQAGRPVAARISGRRRAGTVSAIALAAAIAVAVAVGAVMWGGHRRAAVGASASGVPSGARQLISLLAVLRRPQTAADRAVPWLADEVQRRPFDQPVPTLTRRVFTFPNGRGLFMVVVRHPAVGVPQSPPVRRLDGVALWSLCCNGTAQPAVSLRAHTQLLPEERGVPDAHATYYAYSIVPDGVARVRWVFAALRSATQIRSRVTAWATVHNNVAVAAVTPRPRPVLSATWYAADGHVIAQHTWTRNPTLCRLRPNSCQSYQ